MKGNQLIVSPREIKKLNKWKLAIRQGYKPYLTVRDVNKVGRRHWLQCPIQNRPVHLLSDGELRAYTILVAQPQTAEVWEQYALDIDVTLKIAERLEILHPRDYKTGEARVMTTDFVVLNKVGSALPRIAYTFKYSNQVYAEVGRPVRCPKAWRTWQKFEIENEYWRRLGVEYRLITEKDATKERFWNLEFCAAHRDLKVSNERLISFIETIKEQWNRARLIPLKQLCLLTGEAMGIPTSEAVKLFKYATYNQYLDISHDNCLRLFRPIVLSTEFGE